MFKLNAQCILKLQILLVDGEGETGILEMSVEKIKFYGNLWTKYRYQYTSEELNTFNKFAATYSVNELSRLL